MRCGTILQILDCLTTRDTGVNENIFEDEVDRIVLTTATQRFSQRSQRNLNKTTGSTENTGIWGAF